MAKHSDRITQVTYTLASATTRGLVGIDAQTFAGDKTFNNDVTALGLRVESNSDDQLKLSRSGTFAGVGWIGAGNSQSDGLGYHRIQFYDDVDGLGGGPNNSRFELNLDSGNFDFKSGNLTTLGLLTASNANIGGASGSYSVDIQASAYATLAFKDAANATEGYVQYEYSSDKMFFGANSVADSSVKMTLDGVNGRLGIGTNTPDGKLHVHAASSGDSMTFLTGGGGNATMAAGLAFAEAETGKGEFGMYLNDQAHKLYFTSSWTSVQTIENATKIMTLDRDTGNVGIGTTSPGAPLQVTNGTVAGQPSWNSADIAVFSGDAAVTTAAILQIHQENANGICGIQFSQGAERGNGYIRFENASGTGNLQHIVDGNNSLEINSVGQVSLQASTTTTPINIRGTSQTTTTASSGGNTLPPNPAGFLKIQIGGTDVRIPYYNV